MRIGWIICSGCVPLRRKTWTRHLRNWFSGSHSEFQGNFCLRPRPPLRFPSCVLFLGMFLLRCRCTIFLLGLLYPLNLRLLGLFSCVTMLTAHLSRLRTMACLGFWRRAQRHGGARGACFGGQTEASPFVGRQGGAACHGAPPGSSPFKTDCYFFPNCVF